VREADALRLLAVASLAMHDLPGARESVDRAVALAEAHGSALIAAESLRARAEVARRSGRLDDARRDADAAARIFERLGMTAE
jgi:hypothetical protein